MGHVRRKVLAVAVTVGVIALLSASPTFSASAAGPDTTYLVLAPQGNSTAQAAARVAAAGGTIVADYQQIGVLVVHSTNSSFATAVAGAGVEAAAATTGLGTQLDDSTT